MAAASMAEVALMRKVQELPEVVIFPAEDISTTIGTPYSISFGMTASV